MFLTSVNHRIFFGPSLVTHDEPAELAVGKNGRCHQRFCALYHMTLQLLEVVASQRSPVSTSSGKANAIDLSFGDAFYMFLPFFPMAMTQEPKQIGGTYHI